MQDLLNRYMAFYHRYPQSATVIVGLPTMWITISLISLVRDGGLPELGDIWYMLLITVLGTGGVIWQLRTGGTNDDDGPHGTE